MDELYTGYLTYRNTTFTFVFNENTLCLIPDEKDKDKIHYEWILKKISEGVYTNGDPLLMEESYLIGSLVNTGQKIIFFVNKGSQIGSENETLFVDVFGYIKHKYTRNSIDRMVFYCPEIDYIHPVNEVSRCDYTNINEGEFTLRILPFKNTTSEVQIFEVNNKNVKIMFNINRGYDSGITNNPIQVKSTMIFEFEPTNDYDFILQLWNIGKQFIQYLCYRKNIYFPKTELYTPYKDGKHEHFASLYMLDEDKPAEESCLKKKRHISQFYISGFEGKILTDIANKQLYTRHFPESYKQGRVIDASRFVMITAAFEWEFKRYYSTGVPKSEETICVENEITNEIEEHIKCSTGKKKRIYKYLKKNIKDTSLENKLVHLENEFDQIIGMFGHHLYSLNGETLQYSEMGKRLSKQRNNFAHGNLDQEFIGSSLLDLIYMEYVVYAIQLKYYGLTDTNIKKAINNLFHLNFLIND